MALITTTEAVAMLVDLEGSEVMDMDIIIRITILELRSLIVCLVLTTGEAALVHGEEVVTMVIIITIGIIIHSLIQGQYVTVVMVIRGGLYVC